MVAQDLPVVAPKLSTNNYRAKTVRNCQPAEENGLVAFPTSNTLKPFSGQTLEKYSNDYRYQIGLNYVLLDTLSMRNTTSYEDDLNFWISSLIYNVDGYDADLNFEENFYFLNVEKDKICCFVRTEALRYIFLIKKDLIAKIPNIQNKLINVQNDSNFDVILSQELKKLSYLNLMTGKNYGQIVNMKNYPDQAEKHPEFFRIFENHYLWEKRYIKSNVLDFIKHSEDEVILSKDILKPGKCFDTHEIDLFNEKFVSHMIEEFQDKQHLWEKNFEEDWLGIWNFYVSPLLCNSFFGKGGNLRSGSFRVQRFSATTKKVDDTFEIFDDMIHSDAHFNTFLPFGQLGRDYLGGGWNFIRYDCNTTVAKGRLLISPGDLTHINHVNPVSNGKFEFVSSKFEGGDVLCQEVHGKSHCPGFDFNSSNMEK